MISVIICHHTGDLIYKAVKSIQATDLSIEIIIVSSDQNLKIEGTKVLYSIAGPATKRNIGVRFSTSKCIAFFDDDVEVNPDTIPEMIRVLDNPTIGMVFGKLLNMEFRDRFDEAGGYLTWSGFIWARAESGVKDVRQFDKTEPIFAGKSASCMVKRKVFWEVGGFDESFGILGEESDLAWRIWLKGHKVYYAPNSVTYHAFNTKFKPVNQFYTDERIFFNGCRNYLHMLLKNAPWYMLVVALPVQLFAWLLAAVGHMLAGRYTASWLILRGIAAVGVRLPLILWQRREVRSDIRVSEPYMLKEILRNPPISYYLNRLRSYIRQGIHG